MLYAFALISVQGYAPSVSVAPAAGASRSAARLTRMASETFSEELGMNCEGDCEAVYSKLPPSVKPGVVTGQALVDLLDYAKARRPHPIIRPPRMLCFAHAQRASPPLVCLPRSPCAVGGLRDPRGQLHLVLVDQRVPRGRSQERRADHDPGAHTECSGVHGRGEAAVKRERQQHSGPACALRCTRGAGRMSCTHATLTCAPPPSLPPGSSRQAAPSSTPARASTTPTTARPLRARSRARTMCARWPSSTACR